MFQKRIGVIWAEMTHSISIEHLSIVHIFSIAEYGADVTIAKRIMRIEVENSVRMGSRQLLV